MHKLKFWSQYKNIIFCKKKSKNVSNLEFITVRSNLVIIKKKMWCWGRHLLFFSQKSLCMITWLYTPRTFFDTSTYIYQTYDVIELVYATCQRKAAKKGIYDEEKAQATCLSFGPSITYVTFLSCTMCIYVRTSSRTNQSSKTAKTLTNHLISTVVCLVEGTRLNRIWWYKLNEMV